MTDLRDCTESFRGSEGQINVRVCPRRDLKAWSLVSLGRQKSKKNQWVHDELGVLGGQREIPEYPGSTPLSDRLKTGQL